MRIGILTHHTVINFGAFLQAYALQKAVQTLFPNSEVKIINYIHKKHFIINAFGWFWFYKNRSNIKCWNSIFKLPFTFYKARKNNMSLTKLCFTSHQINKLGFDIIIIGSDEVWNYGDAKSALSVKFGVGLNCNKIISYAPSIGNSSLKKIPQFVIDGLNKFSEISVRDQATRDLVYIITNKYPKMVLDPTFLINWEIVAGKSVTKSQDYILFYYCDHLPIKIKSQIFDYAREHNLAIYGAGESDKDYAQCTVNISPFEWVTMFRNAKFVFTGTFHGVVFSILNNRQFKVYLSNKSRIVKVSNLLSLFNIADREITSDYTFDLNKQQNEIDYKVVNRIIAEKRTESLEYLLKAIGQ